jgi:hypothetical protein
MGVAVDGFLGLHPVVFTPGVSLIGLANFILV